MSLTANIEKDPPMVGKPYWEKTPDEVPCGVCDIDQAGPGAQVCTDPERGLIVACAKCLPGCRERQAAKDAEPRPTALEEYIGVERRGESRKALSGAPMRALGG